MKSRIARFFHPDNKRVGKLLVDRTFERCVMLCGLCMVFALAVLARAYYLQGTDDPGLERLSTNQHAGKITWQAPRGTIYDRNGVELAVSVPVDSAYINPKKIPYSRALVRAVAKILNLPEKKIARAFKADRYFSWLKRRVSPNELAQIKKLIPDGLGVIEESRRFYPHRQLAAHVLGFVGSEGTGLEGIERRYERLLIGGEKIVELKKDARGRPIDVVGSLSQSQDLSGRHVILTIDRNIQHIAERELQAVVQVTKAKAGNVVVMEPETGEILALANWPEFDPNVFSEAREEKRKNRALVDVFEPGSSFKVFLLAKALEKSVVSPNETVFCEEGAYHIKGETIHDVKPKGWLSIADVLKYSSNIGAYKIAERFKAQALYEGIMDFGFGEKTGVELSGESRGIVKSAREWHGVTQGNIGFGQGIAVTSLQLAQAYGALANGGTLVHPRLVKSIIDDQGHTLYASRVRREAKPVVREDIARTISKMMVRVTEVGGTGELAHVSGFQVAGKTGTSQKMNQSGGYSKELFVGSFVGFVPAEKPRLVIAVIIDEPKGEYYGGMIAAPVFSRIATQSLISLGIAPAADLLAQDDLLAERGENKISGQDMPLTGTALRQYLRNLDAVETNVATDKFENIRKNFHAALASTNENTTLSPDAMPDLTGLSLREAFKKLELQELKFRVEGYGFVYDQKPRPGTKVGYRAECVLYARPMSAEQGLDDGKKIVSRNHDS